LRREQGEGLMPADREGGALSNAVRKKMRIWGGELVLPGGKKGGKAGGGGVEGRLEGYGGGRGDF